MGSGCLEYFFSYFADELSAPVRSENRPFRAVINDIFKMTPTALSISAKIEAGFVENGEKVYIMPNADPVIVKGQNRK